MFFLPTIPIVGATSRMQLWESTVLLRPSRLYKWPHSITIFIKALKTLWMGAEMYSLCSCTREASYDSSLLIKPATYQSGVICFFLHLSLPLWVQFWILPELPRLQTTVVEPVRRLKKWVLGKEASLEEISGWPFISAYGEVAHVSDACEPLHDIWLRNCTWDTPAKKETQLVGTRSGPLQWTVPSVTDAN